MKYRVYFSELEPDKEDELNNLIKGGKIIYVEKAKTLPGISLEDDDFWKKAEEVQQKTIYKILVEYS